VADFETANIQYTIMFIGVQKFNFTTKPAMLYEPLLAFRCLF